jgi:hypothetical protein
MTLLIFVNTRSSTPKPSFEQGQLLDSKLLVLNFNLESERPTVNFLEKLGTQC